MDLAGNPDPDWPQSPHLLRPGQGWGTFRFCPKCKGFRHTWELQGGKRLRCSTCRKSYTPVPKSKEKLLPAEKESLIESFLDEMTSVETASRTGLSERTVKKYFQRGRKGAKWFLEALEIAPFTFASNEDLNLRHRHPDRVRPGMQEAYNAVSRRRGGFRHAEPEHAYYLAFLRLCNDQALGRELQIRLVRWWMFDKNLVELL